jgi:DNA-binding transcriptional regulator YiaG
VPRSSRSLQVAFRFTTLERAALLAWAARRFPDAVLSGHEAAKVIVLQRLVDDGVLDDKGKLTVPAAKLQKERISGSNLRTAREARGLTQQELADKLGVLRPTLAMWETGAKHVPARLAEIVIRWMKTGKDPDAEVLEKRERRTAWARLLDDRLIGDDE